MISSDDDVVISKDDVIGHVKDGGVGDVSKHVKDGGDSDVIEHVEQGGDGGVVSSDTVEHKQSRASAK